MAKIMALPAPETVWHWEVGCYMDLTLERMCLRLRIIAKFRAARPRCAICSCSSQPPIVWSYDLSKVQQEPLCTLTANSDASKRSLCCLCFNQIHAASHLSNLSSSHPDIFNTRYNIILPFYQTIVAAIARHYSSSVLFPKTAIALGCIAQILLSTEEFQRVKHTFAREANNSTAVFIASCFQENRNLAHIHSAKYFGTNQPHRMIKVRLFSIMI
jgi:hypothetical protein